MSETRKRKAQQDMHQGDAKKRKNLEERLAEARAAAKSFQAKQIAKIAPRKKASPTEKAPPVKKPSPAKRASPSRKHTSPAKKHASPTPTKSSARANASLPKNTTSVNTKTVKEIRDKDENFEERQAKARAAAKAFLAKQNAMETDLSDTAAASSTAKPSAEVQRSRAKNWAAENAYAVKTTKITVTNIVEDLDSLPLQKDNRQQEESLPPGFGSPRPSTSAGAAITNNVTPSPRTFTTRQILSSLLPTSPRRFDSPKTGYNQRKSPPPSTKGEDCWSLLGGIAGLVTLIMLFHILPSFVDYTASNKLPPCFIDSLHVNDASETIYSCDAVLEPIPCPDFGFCAGGRLISCRDTHFEVSPDSRCCILSKASNDTLSDVEALLVDWMIQNSCPMTGKVRSLPQSESALFPLSEVQEKFPSIDPLLVSFSRNLQVQIDDDAGHVVIGLSNTYVDSEFRLPFTCRLTLLLLEVANIIWSTASSIVATTFFIALKISMAHPVQAAISLLVLWLLIRIRCAMLYRKRLIQNVVEVRDLCYQKLMVDPSLEHTVLHLRDGIAMDMYPSSREGRAYVIAKVWPKVVVDVRQDNRVAKYSDKVGGKPRDIWQWAATGQKAKGI
jgi:hypothetical protein